MSQEEHTTRVNRESYFQIWGEPPPGDLPSITDEGAPSAPRVISEAPRPKEVRDQTITRLINDLEVLTKRMESVFNSLKTTMERVEQAQLSQRDELKALSRRLGVSLEKRRASESRRPGNADGARRERVSSPSPRPPSFFAAIPRSRVAGSRTSSLLIGFAVGVFVFLVTAVAGLGSTSSSGFAVTGVNILLGFGFGLVTVGILLRQRARRKTRRRPPV